MIEMSRNQRSKVLLSICCVAAALGPSASASLIVNGSLESPYKFVGAGFQSVTPTGWIDHGPGNRGALINNTGQAIKNYPLAEDGDQYWELRFGIPLDQNIHVSTPGTYSISWYENVRLLYGQSSSYSYTVSLLAGANTVSSTTYGETGPGGPWISRSEQLNLAPGDYTLKFADSTPALLDNIDMNMVAVPEPSTFLVGGILALSLFLPNARLIGTRKRMV